MYLRALEVMLEGDEVDAVIVLALHQVPGIEDPVELAREIGRLVSERGNPKPVVAVDTGGSEAAVMMRETFDSVGIPSYPTPERAAQAVRALCEYGAYLRRRGALERYLSGWAPLGQPS